MWGQLSYKIFLAYQGKSLLDISQVLKIFQKLKKKWFIKYILEDDNRLHRFIDESIETNNIDDPFLMYVKDLNLQQNISQKINNLINKELRQIILFKNDKMTFAATQLYKIFPFYQLEEQIIMGGHSDKIYQL